MPTTIEIVAVGDILMLQSQINSAKIPGLNQYLFHSMFEPIMPYIQSADLAIGNLESPLAGRESPYQQRNPETHYPMLNCPDELASALKDAGFHVLITANNHCLDRGVKGLKRTLAILDQHELEHTGTFNSLLSSKDLLIKDIQGIKVGILAYTRGVNFNPYPNSQPWLVNRLRKKKIRNDIRQLKEKNIDLVIVAIHFGKEFRHTPVEHQQNWVKKLFQYGADIVLGCHPHVLQPMILKQVEDGYGEVKDRFAIYSLGNFISDELLRHPQTLDGVILSLTVQKDDDGMVSIVGVNYIPTWIQRKKTKGRLSFKVIPISDILSGKSDIPLSQGDSKMMTNSFKRTKKILGEIHLNNVKEKEEE